MSKDVAFFKNFFLGQVNSVSEQCTHSRAFDPDIARATMTCCLLNPILNIQF